MQKKPAEQAKPSVARPGKAVASYRVQAGDTLELIAKRFYGSPTKWRVILRANPGLNPATLRPGVVLQLPGPETARPLAARSVAATRALERARTAIAAAQHATDQEVLDRSIGEAERALMDARRAVWKLREGKSPQR